MNVLIINGSPRKNGNTYLTLNEMCKIFKEENINVQLEEIGTEAIRGCIACLNCKNTGKCITGDIVNRLALAFKAANGLVVGSPVYYASANASLIALLDRLF